MTASAPHSPPPSQLPSSLAVEHAARDSELRLALALIMQVMLALARAVARARAEPRRSGCFRLGFHLQPQALGGSLSSRCIVDRRHLSSAPRHRRRRWLCFKKKLVPNFSSDVTSSGVQHGRWYWHSKSPGARRLDFRTYCFY